MNRRIAAIGLAWACGLAGCRACPCPCPCPSVAVAPPTDPTGDASAQVFVEMTCVRVPEAAVTALPAGAAAHATVLLDAGRRDALLAAWAKDGTAEVVHAPAIVVLPAQRASIFVGEEFATSPAPPGAAPRPFVAPEDDPTRAWVGMRIFVTPTVEDGAVRLQLEATWREAAHPEATDVAGLDVRSARLERPLRLTPGQTALIVADGTLERAGRRAWMVLLVGARALAPARPPPTAGAAVRSS